VKGVQLMGFEFTVEGLGLGNYEGFLRNMI